MPHTRWACIEYVGKMGGPLTFLGKAEVVRQYAQEHGCQGEQVLYEGEDYGEAEDVFRTPGPYVNLLG